MARRSKRAKVQVINILETLITIGAYLLGLVAVIFKIIYVGLTTYYTEFNKSVREYDEHREYLANNVLDDEEEQALAQELEDTHTKAINRLKTLMSYTENKLYYQIVKTEFPGEGRVREYINFLTYDKETVAVDNANVLVNTVMDNVLGVYKGRSKRLQDTIVLDDYACDMKDISRNIANRLGVEEVKIVMT